VRLELVVKGEVLQIDCAFNLIEEAPAPIHVTDFVSSSRLFSILIFQSCLTSKLQLPLSQSSKKSCVNAMEYCTV
jgi:hypothetical protein